MTRTPSTRLLATLAGIAVVAALIWAGLPAPAAQAAPASRLVAAERTIEEALAAVKGGRVDEARQEYQEFLETWHAVEDGVRAGDAAAYASIEGAMRTVEAALAAQPVDAKALESSLEELEKALEEYADSAAGGVAPASGGDLAGAERSLEKALDAVTAGNLKDAETQLDAFAGAWPFIEGGVKSRAPQAYETIESRMAAAFSALRDGDGARAQAAIEAMREALEPLAAAGAGYTWWDAAVILLREGLEAILIVAALLAFVNRGGAPAQRNWIYGGALAGVVGSVALALGMSSLLSAAVAGAGIEVVEGAAGIAAVVMMLTVGAWLHSRSTLAAWQKYIKEQVAGALARGSLVWLGAVAFLAVLREGAETVIFLVGMAPSIRAGALYGGIAAGLAVLLVIGFAVIRMGLRVPVRPFFLAATVLIDYLALKFTGQSLHALQVAGVVPAHGAAWLPEVEWLGVYPSFETLVPQVALLGFVVWQFAATERRGRRAAARAEAVSSR
ncbi:MAG: FTR1 family iron permease [Firmicutes bacterium]|nr:FTR1 family iron permease [Bacillota bacterium]